MNFFNIYLEKIKKSIIKNKKKLDLKENQILNKIVVEAPPENFDLGGILHGGIPIKEIEDNYIQEVLNGFDVRKILVNYGQPVEFGQVLIILE